MGENKGNNDQLIKEPARVQNQVAELDRLASDCRQMRTALRQVQMVIENSPAVLFRWRAAEGWPVELVTRNVLRFGYTPEELLSGAVTYAMLIHADDLDRVTHEVQDYSDSGSSSYRQEYRVTTKGGETRWVDDRTVIERDADGRITHYQAIVLDITERKQTEEALRESEERLKLALSASSDGIWDWDIPSGNAFFSPRYYTMLGYEPYELPQDYASWKSLVHPDDVDRAEKHVLDHIRNNDGSYAIELRMATKAGDWRWFLTRGMIVERDAGGRPSRMVGTHTDITKRKQAEESLLQSETKYRFLTEKMNDVIWTTDMNFNVTYISPSVEKLVGFTPEECRQMAAWEAITPQSYSKVLDLLSSELRREQQEGMDPDRTITLEMEDYHKNGSTVWVECLASFIRDDDGTAIGVHGVSRDITERRRAAVEKERLIGELRQALANVKILSGMLPICASCKKIRDDKGYWNQLESYISSHSDVLFSHSICPECARKLYPDLVD